MNVKELEKLLDVDTSKGECALVLFQKRDKDGVLSPGSFSMGNQLALIGQLQLWQAHRLFVCSVRMESRADE